LNQIIHGDRPLPEFANELEKAKWRHKLIHENQHIVDSYFIDRIRVFIKIFHSKNSLEYS